MALVIALENYNWTVNMVLCIFVVSGFLLFALLSSKIKLSSGRILLIGFAGAILFAVIGMNVPISDKVMILWIFAFFGFLLFTLLSSKILDFSTRRSTVIGILGAIVFVAIDIWVLKPSGWVVPMLSDPMDRALIALTIVGWPGYTRLLRGEILRIKQEDYIEAARAVGCSDLRIMTRHILPNAIYPILISASLDIGAIVLTVAALGFLNIGVQVGYADWGQIIGAARRYIDMKLTNWYAFFIPGFFILLFVLGWNLLGDAFRDILDPTLRRR